MTSTRGRNAEQGPVPVYRAGRQLMKLRLVMPLCLLCGGVVIWFGWYVLNSYGLHPSEGGSLAPLHVRLPAAALLFIVGALMLGGIVVFMESCYVAAIDRLPGGQGLRLTLAGVIAKRTLDVDPADVVGSKFQHGVYNNPHGVSVNAPWYSVRIRGRRLPLVLDTQGQVLDRTTFTRFVTTPPLAGARGKRRG
ncbi:hypothetical protein BH23GEM9_BH23GEM9_29730 [soil metagenome]